MSRRAFLLAGGGLAVGGATLLLPGELVAGPDHRWWGGTGPTPSEDPGPRTIEIRMGGDASGSQVWFDPVGLRVRPGDTVRWILERGVHSTTAYHPAHGRPLRIPKAAEPWDSGILMEPGATFEITLTETGVHDYFCLPHEAAGMVGRIVVASVEPDASGVHDPGHPARSTAASLPRAAALGFPPVGEILASGSVRGAPGGP